MKTLFYIITVCYSVCATVYASDNTTLSTDPETQITFMDDEATSTSRHVDNKNVIKFEGYSVGTKITDQYANNGLIFGSPTGGFEGYIQKNIGMNSGLVLGSVTGSSTMYFTIVNPFEAGYPQMTVDKISFDLRNNSWTGEVFIYWYDDTRVLLGQTTQTAYGEQHYVLEASGIDSYS